MVLAENRHTDRQNRIESPEVKLHIYEQVIFDKGAKNTQWRKKCLFDKWCWENWKAPCKRMKVDYSVSPCAKINSRWIKDLNIRSETVNYIE